MHCVTNRDYVRRVGITESIAFGRYLLLRSLQAHGPAELYLGLQRSAAGVEKVVVIKRLSRGLSQDPRLAEALLEEARIAGQLSHVNIAQVFDAGEFEGSYYFAREHVHGKSLRKVLQALGEKRALFPVEHAVHLGIQLCHALAHAHERTDLHGNRVELAHGALSPDNVFVSFAGEAKITDFGLLASQKHTLSALGIGSEGTVAYLAPEQMRGEAPDPLSDLYSVGMLLLELTGGKAPFRRPPTLGPTYPPKLEAILLQAAARRRAHRFQSAAELGAELEGFARTSGVRMSSTALGRFLHDLFPGAEARHARELRHIREPREVLPLGVPREEARTIPDSSPPVPPSSDHPPLEMPVFPATPEFSLAVPGGGFPHVTTHPPVVQTWPPNKQRASRYLAAATALAIGMLLGALAVAVGRQAPPAAPAAQAPTAAVADRGSLEIQSDPPGANIFLEGELMAELTPTRLAKLPIGRPLHFRIVRPGYDTADAETTLAPQHPNDRITLRLAPASVSLYVTIDAPESALWVDGKFISSRKVLGLAVGEDHKIAVSAPGRIGKIVMFRSEQGGEKRLDFKLDPARSPR